MKPSIVAVVKYERPGESVQRAVELSGGLDGLPSGSRVFIKPNIVFWTRLVHFPKWGVITTSRAIEDMVVCLKERGIDHITIGEGPVILPNDTETLAHAFESLGYTQLEKRYGARLVNVHQRPFTKVEIDAGIELRFNKDIVESDLIVDVPVMKTHNQTVVSLAIKNLKGALDLNSRKKCHSADPEKNLHYMVARLPDHLPPIFALLDGIYTNERGPSFDGKMRRENILVASGDVLSADMVGAKILGYAPSEVPYLVHAARNSNRPLDLSDIDVVGEIIDSVASPHKFDFTYAQTEDGELPLPLVRQGLKGVSYRKYDLSMCTYCSGINGLLLTAIRNAWQGEPWDDVEVLTGKMMKPTPGKKKTILVGKCIYQANKDNPDIQEMIAIKGCPPKDADIIRAFHQAGIQIDPALFENAQMLPGLFMGRYEGKPEFDESLFQVG
jgi:uncharacterized protein (DUF362 family)